MTVCWRYMVVVLVALSFIRNCNAQACGQNFTALQGVITSPFYPKNYTNMLDCIYVIRAPAGYRVTLSFHDFRLEASDSCEYDFVETHDGEFLTSSIIDNLFCEVTVPYDVRTIGNKMLIRFKTNNEVTDIGFNASYTAKIIPQEFFLVTISGGYIDRVDVNTLNFVNVPVIGLYSPFGIHYDPVDDRMYWTDYTLKEIRSAFLNGSDNSRVRNIGQGNNKGGLEGITLDTQSRLIFYTDAVNQVIGLITISTYQHKYVITDNLDKPRAIVLDNLYGVVFWTDWGTRPKIERANYDGSGRKVIVSISIVYPNGLALDANRNRLYWVDSGMGTVERTDTDGLNRAKVFSSSNTMYISLALHNNQLYITDWTSAGSNTKESYVYRLNTDGTDVKRIFHVENNRFNGIYVYSAISDRTGPNGCTNGNGGCSHICIPSSGNNTKCLCPSGQYLSDDQRTCLSQDSVPVTSLNYPLIGGGAGGGVVLILLIIVIIVCVIKRRGAPSYDSPRSQPQENKEMERTHITFNMEVQNDEIDNISNIYSEIAHSHEESIKMANMAALVDNGYLHPTNNLQLSMDQNEDSRCDYLHPI